MKINRTATLTAACLILFAFTSAYGQKAGTHAATERALRQVDVEWAAAAQARDFEKVLSYYSATAIELPPNKPIRQTKKEIGNAWRTLIQTPGATLSWRPTKVEVSEARDMGYIAGTYLYTQPGPDGQPIVDRGKYLQVMRKVDDGSWKCVAVSWNSDLPAPPPKPAK